jgi:hypothetical protein
MVYSYIDYRIKIYNERIYTMEHPYRVHSSIGFGFLQLLFISSLAYPTPPPPVYHNVAVFRLFGTVYYTIFQDTPLYLKLECATILLEIICDTLYIRYIIQDYTYIFGVIDIISNALFCLFVVLSVKNSDIKTERIADTIDKIRKTFVDCCFGRTVIDEAHAHAHAAGHDSRNHMYKSVITDETETRHPPVYTFGARQAFKPSFYNSSWGKEYINAKVEHEFDKIDTELGDIGMITGSDGTTQYIRFDEPGYSTAVSGANHYANLFISPYFTRDGTPITCLSGIDKVGVCLFIYNLTQFIYQLMMYSSIISRCREFHNTTAMEQWLC